MTAFSLVSNSQWNNNKDVKSLFKEKKGGG